MRKRVSQHHMDGLIILLMFGLFAACILMVLLTGAGAYSRLTERDRLAYDRRVCTQYIAERVRQADTAGGVGVEPFGGTTALTLTQDGYVTRVYWYDGYMMELYTAEDSQLEPQDGERIMELEGLNLSMDGGLLTAELRGEDGTADTLRLSLRSGEGAAR